MILITVVLLTHPEFLGSKSMPRFAKMIGDYLESQSVPYSVWSPKSLFHKLSPHGRFSKWLGYIDQYIIFPMQIHRRAKHCGPSTIFVFCDQALGPWVPLVAKRPHIIHCHDFMALKSALGYFPENPVSWSGKVYQAFIRRGFQKGKYFIPISIQTENDLYEYGRVIPKLSKVVYNGLNYPYKKQGKSEAFENIFKARILNEDVGCLLHVGGGQWYKNTVGVIKIYSKYCLSVEIPKPLILVSPNPEGLLFEVVSNVPSNGMVKFVQGIDVLTLESLYSYANAFLFPSLAEGFGWPIIEAQACGCIVITTNEAPMNEIGGPSARYLERYLEQDDVAWVEAGKNILLEILSLSEVEKLLLERKSVEWAQQFSGEKALRSYLNEYKAVVNNHI
jgi:glycosyltransferase involved in cell wall biosynthesis